MGKFCRTPRLSALQGASSGLRNTPSPRKSRATSAPVLSWHGRELAPTGESPRMPLGLVLLHRRFEFPAREQLQHLRKAAAYFVHRLRLLWLYWFFSGTQSSLSGTQTLTGRGHCAPHIATNPLIFSAVGSGRPTSQAPPVTPSPPQKAFFASCL